MTAAHHPDGRLVRRASGATICGRRFVYCPSPDAAMAKKEYMFPFVTVVECEQRKMIGAIGPDAGRDGADGTMRGSSRSCSTRGTSTA